MTLANRPPARPTVACLRVIATTALMLLGAHTAHAARGRPVGGPAANAGEMPALAALLDRTGWTPTPELSGMFQAGSIFSDEA